jgi:hypothetical protein
LAFGLLAATLSGALPLVFRSRLAWLLIAFCIWGALRTIPFFHSYGIDALRDGAVWGYSAFALIVASCVLQERRVAQLVRCFRRCLPWFFAWVPLAWGIVSVADDAIPTLPGTDVKLLVLNPGLVAVHLAGAATFLLLGLGGGGERSTRLRDLVAKWALATGWTLAFLIAASITRGGLLAVLASIIVVAIFRPMATARKLATACLCAGATIFVAPAFLGERMSRDSRPFEDSRVISPGQLAANVTSIVGNRGDDLEGTRTWRILWWRTIIDYTLLGDYFWTGKGFGINLGDDDGFQPTVSQERPNRSPHNGHLTILARAGVPGVALWVLLQGSFAAALTRAYFSARRQGREWHARVTLWILAYWTAFLIHGASDVFLEGPTGGIWFWCVFGLGMAVLQDQRHVSRVTPSITGWRPRRRQS